MTKCRKTLRDVMLDRFDISEQEALGGDYGHAILWRIEFGQVSRIYPRQEIYVLAVTIEHAICLAMSYAELIDSTAEPLYGENIYSIQQVSDIIVADPRHIIDPTVGGIEARYRGKA